VFFLLSSFVRRPMLEEKWDLGSQALIPNIRHPFVHDWSQPT
jgi:hypothetical protein